MSGDAQARAGKTGSSGLLLLECDFSGRILWMSEETQSALGPVSSLAEAVRSAQRSERALRFSGVWLPSGTAGASARPAGSPWQAAAGEALGALERAALRHYFLLEEIERRLAALARLRRRRSNAVRLLELERQRLGRDLHTGIGQVLSAIRLQSEVISRELTAPSAPIREAVGRIGALVQHGLDQARALSHRLHPPDWQRLTLEASIRQLWDLSGFPQEFEASLVIGPVSQEPELEVKTVAYRTAQEAFSNIALHAKASRVAVVLEVAGGRLRLTVRDDGVGFNAAEYLSRPATVAEGIGLRSLREQAAALGGRLHINSGARGTTVELSIPVLRREPDQLGGD